MRTEAEHVYPRCPVVVRTIVVGGSTKQELLAALHRNSVLMNESAEQIFASELFTIAQLQHSVTTVELAARDLGLVQGATTAEIFAKAATLGLDLCPVELGPHLRLQYLDQPEGFVGHPIQQHQAPYGSLTVASEALSEDDTFPKGFYLRRIEGALWLRGYRSGAGHIWQPDDYFVFRQA